MSPSPEELAAAARQLVQSLQPREVLALLDAQNNKLLAEQENAKTTYFTGWLMPESDWTQMCAHMTDGGGVNDRSELAKSLLTRLLTGKQDETFWRDAIHYMKATLKIDGNVVPHPVPADIGPGVQRPVTINGAPAAPGPL